MVDSFEFCSIYFYVMKIDIYRFNDVVRCSKSSSSVHLFFLLLSLVIYLDRGITE